jgi:transcriptional regulator GlxA family with amidase domain
MRTIGILLFDDVEELDAIGPWEVLSWWCARFPGDGWAVTTFSRDGGTVRCAKGLRVLADHSYEDVPALDVLLYPGGRGARARVDDEAEVAWIRDQRQEIPLLASVCTGSLVFAKAGLLKGRPATTHWASLDRLADIDPTIDVRRDDRFVDDGDVVTSAGISAGIDMALHLVSRFAGVERAREVRRGIQYDPQPPV